MIVAKELNKKVVALRKQITDLYLKEYPIGVKIRTVMDYEEGPKLWISKGLNYHLDRLMVRPADDVRGEDRAFFPEHMEHDIVEMPK